ncbi:hypothetical protein KCU88_g7243, partial [Aureobasidium melanogenum]
MVLTSATIATTTSSSRHHYPLSPSPDSSNSNFSPEPAVIGITLDHKGAKLRLAAMAEQQQPYQEQQQQQQQQLPQQQGSESYVSAHEFTRRRPLTRSVRRSRNPPRNTEGDIYCDHPDCHDSNQIFQRPSSATAATAPSTGITSSSSPSTHLQDASLTAQQQQMQQQQQQQQQQLIHQLREDVGKKEDIVRRQASEILRLHSFMQALPPRLVYGLMQRQQAQGQQQQQQQQQQRVRTQTQTQIQAQALQGSATATATAPRISEVLYTSPTLHTRVQTQSAITPPKQNQMSSQRAVSSAPKADAAEDKQFNIKQDGGD